MKDLNPYLFFDGDCRAAMMFYQSLLGGTLEMATYGEAQENCPDGMADHIMHANLTAGDIVLMASDTPTEELTVGDNVQLTLQCESQKEIEKLFAGFSEGGEVLTALEDTFWDAVFGTLRDRYGIRWMFNFDKNG